MVQEEVEPVCVIKTELFEDGVKARVLTQVCAHACSEGTGDGERTVISASLRVGSLVYEAKLLCLNLTCTWGGTCSARRCA